MPKGPGRGRRKQFFERYEENTLGVISDIEFPRDGVPCPEAGTEFARRVRAHQPDIPVMLQSSRPENRALAEAVGASFLLKDSPTLLHDLRRFIADHSGFGDFVFRLPAGAEVARARDLRALEEQLATVPADSIGYQPSETTSPHGSKLAPSTSWRISCNRAAFPIFQPWKRCAKT